MPRDATDLYIDDKFGWRACVKAGEVSLTGSNIATLGNSSPVSRYLYIDLCLDRTFAQRIGSAKVKSKSDVTQCDLNLSAYARNFEITLS